MKRNLPVYLLIAAAVLVFGMFGIEKFTAPSNWIGFLPPWIDGLFGISKDLWLKVFGALEVLFAILLLIPVRRVRQVGAALITLHLLAVVIQLMTYEGGAISALTMRDIGLMLSSAALFFLL